MNDSQDITVGRWLLRLFAWDGMLPLAIWLVPILVRNLLPRNDFAFVLVAFLAPISAVFVRYIVGMKYIRENNCGPIMRGIQTRILLIAILIMALIDIASIAMQGIVPFAEILELALAAYVIYLPLMAFALYPGFRNRMRSSGEYGVKESTRLNAFGGEEYV